MPCYNAAMGKPFQFSMQKMFVAVAWVATAAAIVGIVIRGEIRSVVEIPIFCAPFFALGSAVGSKFGSPVRGAVAGLVCAIPFLVWLTMPVIR